MTDRPSVTVEFGTAPGGAGVLCVLLSRGEWADVESRLSLEYDVAAAVWNTVGFGKADDRALDQARAVADIFVSHELQAGRLYKGLMGTWIYTPGSLSEGRSAYAKQQP